MKRHFLFTIERQGILISVVFFCALFSSFAHGLENSTGINGSNVQDVWSAGYTGQSISVGLISEDHTLVTHEAFNGHAHWYDATDQSNYVTSNHDTTVGGIICSRGGVLHPNDKGIAPEAELYSVKIANDTGISSAWVIDGLDYLLGQQCQVVVTAIQLSGTDLTPDGNSFWSLIYDYYAYEYNLIFATAAGNYSSSITVFGDTFNSITTGGLIIDTDDIYYQTGSSSNPGPTTDGRQKPDIVAPSAYQLSPIASSDTSWSDNPSYITGQTSWSVPHAGGVAAVLLSYANESAELDDDQNVVIKAVIVNSTFPNINDKSGNSTVNQLESEPDWPWNTDRGYGRIDAKRAYDTLSSSRITPSSSTNNIKGWGYDYVTSGQADNFTIQGTENERLVITLTWNRRVVWTDPRPRNGIINPGELTPYLANLDLEVYDPDGILISPASSTIDNLEKYDLLLTKTGNYEIRVINQSGSESAYYALAFELLEPLPADFNTDYAVNDLDLVDWIPYWLNTDCLNIAQPCYDYNLNLDSSIDLSDFSAFAEKWLTYDNRYYTP